MERVVFESNQDRNEVVCRCGILCKHALTYECNATSMILVYYVAILGGQDTLRNG